MGYRVIRNFRFCCVISGYLRESGFFILFFAFLGDLGIGVFRKIRVFYKRIVGFVSCRNLRF